MEMFGVGGSEVLLLVFLAGVVLGPRRLVRLIRETRQFMDKFRRLAGTVTEELNREFDLLEAVEAGPAPAAPPAADTADQPEAPPPPPPNPPSPVVQPAEAGARPASATNGAHAPPE